MSFIPEAVEYHIYGLPTPILMSAAAWGVISAVSVAASRRISFIPKGAQNFTEFLLEMIYSLADHLISE